MKKELWIVIAGMDGAGKTTLQNNLLGYFRERNLKTKKWRFPFYGNLMELMNNTIGGGRPWKDNYSDQLLLSLDARIVGTVLVPQWREANDVLISENGYIDTFVHGKCCGKTYKDVDQLLRTNELERCDVIIHLNANHKVAFERIKEKPDDNKFHIPEYLEKKEKEVEEAYHQLVGENADLAAFKGIPNLYIDTTEISPQQTFAKVLLELDRLALI